MAAAVTPEPTARPIAEPTTAPPTAEPAETPIPEPTAAPTAEPTDTPTSELTASTPTEPTPEPSVTPTAEPTATPTPEPATAATPRPTVPPTVRIPSGPRSPKNCRTSEDETTIHTYVTGRFQWSPDGSQIFFTDSGRRYGPPVDAVQVDGSRLWRIEPSSGHGYAGALRTFDVSADGSRIVYSTCGYAQWDDDYEIVVSNIDGTDTKRLTENSSSELYPVWSPDGAHVAFVRHSELTIYTMAASDRTSVSIDVAPVLPAWSPDGRSIAFLAHATPVGYSDRLAGLRINVRVDAYTVVPDGSGLRRIVSNAVSAPSWSPDGDRIAVATFEGDGAALYTFSADGSDPVMVARIDARDIVDGRDRAAHPAAIWVPNVSWSPDGSKIMYGALSVVNVNDGSLVLDTQLIRFDWVGNYGTRFVNYEDPSAFPLAAWSPDASRIAMLRPAMPAEQIGYWDLESYPLLYTMSSDGTDPRILLGAKEGVMTTWPVPVRPLADVEACSKGVIVPDPDENPGLVEDCGTLLVMRHKLAGSGRPLDWTSDTRINKWAGVGVGGQPPRVRTLHIFESSRELYGQIPPEIGNLAELRELTIDLTHINGRIPREIGRLVNLESLEVAFTHMGGSIPAQIGNLTNLKQLVMTDSQFSGSIPAEIGNLANLEVLDLQNNNISGHLPPELGNLTNLRLLILGGVLGNRLTGPIPPELGSMVSLETLVLNRNRLSGSIPAEIAKLTNLTELDLSGNELSGCLPQELRNLRDLRYSSYVQYGNLRYSNDRLGLEYCD